MGVATLSAFFLKTYVYKQKVEARRPEKMLLQGLQQFNKRMWLWSDSSSRRLWWKKMGNIYKYTETVTRVRELKRKNFIWKNTRNVRGKKWHQVTPNQQYSQQCSRKVDGYCGRAYWKFCSHILLRSTASKTSRREEGAGLYTSHKDDIHAGLRSAF